MISLLFGMIKGLILFIFKMIFIIFGSLGSVLRFIFTTIGGIFSGIIGSTIALGFLAFTLIIACTIKILKKIA